MRRLGSINHLETDLAAVYFDLPVASLVTIERFPYSSDLAGLVERCTVGVGSGVESSLVGHLGCSVDKCLLPDPDLLTMNFAESSRLSVWLEGAAELAVVP